jgi:hypothetical protein
MISRVGQRRGRPVFSGGGNSGAMIIGIGQIASEKPKKVNLNRATELVPETWLPEPLRPRPLTAACRLHPDQAQLESNLTERR